MSDRIFEIFLNRQLEEGLELAATSDIVDLLPVDGPPPQHYIRKRERYGNGTVLLSASIFRPITSGLWTLSPYSGGSVLPRGSTRIFLPGIRTYQTGLLLYASEKSHPACRLQTSCTSCMRSSRISATRQTSSIRSTKTAVPGREPMQASFQSTAVH